ncbi:MAG: type II secretion system protein [Sporichthyaceae bacterium]|nr:type II secretion system protein [Sporichthyaceae bacterium]
MTLSIGALTAGLAGALIAAGLVLIAGGLRRRERPPARPVTVRPLARLTGLLGRRVPLAALAGVVTAALTRWPVAAIGAAALVLAWPALFGGVAAEKRAIARLEALRMWTESLRDTIAGAAGLEQAIPATVPGAQPVLHEPLRRLEARLHTRTGAEQALREFADELNDPSADLLIAPLILNAQLQGRGLKAVLTSLVDNAREQAAMRNRVLAQRAGTRRGTQIIAAVTVVAVIGLAVFNPSFVAPYGTPVGQLVLLVVFGLFALGFAALRALAGITTPGRFLTKGDGLSDRGWTS